MDGKMIKVLVAMLIVVGVLLGKSVLKLKKRCRQLENENKRINVNVVILKDWLTLRQNNLKVEDWLKQNGINRIALYGYGILGKALYDELIDSDIKIEYIVDKNYKSRYASVPVVPVDNIGYVDAIIVSVVNYYDQIEDDLLGRCKCPIISLEDIIYGEKGEIC